MQTDQSHTAETVEELLASLAEALPDAELPEFERRASLIRALLASETRFSAKGFIADEVSGALDL